jgi:hypothetical protein
MLRARLSVPGFCLILLLCFTEWGIGSGGPEQSVEAELADPSLAPRGETAASRRVEHPIRADRGPGQAEEQPG